MIPFNKEILVALRKENNYTQESLANEVGVSRSLVSSWETGKAIPNEEDIKRLNAIFHTTLYYEEETVETKPIAEHKNYLILICNYGIILLLFFLEWHMHNLCFNKLFVCETRKTTEMGTTAYGMFCYLRMLLYFFFFSSNCSVRLD